MIIKTIKAISYVIGVFIMVCISNNVVSASTSDNIRIELESYIQNVIDADGYQYDTKDSVGNTMDCLKIIPKEGSDGEYIGVYHCYVNGGTTAYVCLATSSDLFNWNFIGYLSGGVKANATQPTIYFDGSGYMVAWEQEPNNYVKLAYYDNWQELEDNNPSKTFDCPRQLSSYAEGTPNIYSASSDGAIIGFHYYNGGKADRQATGVMKDWNSWDSKALPDYDNALLYYGVGGNIGDRDNINFNGFSFDIIEAGGNNSDFGSWRTFLYDNQTGNADKLSIITHGGSLAFANPTITQMEVNGQDAIVVTLFIPTESSAEGESGELVFYKYIKNGFNRVYQAEGMELSHGVGRQEGNGWSANTSKDGAGHLIFGPYESDIKHGNRTAIFKMKVDGINIINQNKAVANIEVYDANSNQIIASKEIKKSDFLKGNCYDVFSVPFVSQPGQNLEFRVWWTDKSYLLVDYILIN